MKNVLLPNNESEKFDKSKCIVTLEQIECQLTKAEQDMIRLTDEFNTMGDSIKKGNITFTRRAIADMIIRVEGKISALKEIRSMAYKARNE